MLGFITLIGTRWKTHRANFSIWGNSPFALMFFERAYLDNQVAASVRGISQSELMQRAKDVRVRLLVRQDSARLFDEEQDRL